MESSRAHHLHLHHPQHFVHHHHYHHCHCHHHHHHHHPLCALKPPHFLPSQIPNFFPHHHFHPRPRASLNPIPFPPQHHTPASAPESNNLEIPEEPQLLQEGLEEADGEDDVFVMTDEWVEFFARSEEKRRLKKKQAQIMRKKEKKNNKGSSSNAIA